MSRKTTRVGLIGYGHIGTAVHKMIDDDPASGIEVAFVHDAVAGRLEGLKPELVLEDLAAFESRGADLIIEMAHPEVSRRWAKTFLEKTNYMLISVTALADPELEATLEETSKRCGTRAYIPHGGVVGMDALFENRDVWEDVHVVMKKPPKNVDLTGAGVEADSINSETVLYDGAVRGICPLFPRNVNTLATIAYAGIGFERTRATLVVNPAWDTAVVAIHAKGPGVDLRVERAESITGVTGASTPASIYNSVRTIGSTGAGIHLR